MKLTFEWDEAKAREGFKKHKMTFDEGKTVFNDPFLLTCPDIDSYDAEARHINIGLSAMNRILLLIHTQRRGAIRIISCRKATVRDRKDYEES